VILQAPRVHGYKEGAAPRPRSRSGAPLEGTGGGRESAALISDQWVKSLAVRFRSSSIRAAGFPIRQLSSRSRARTVSTIDRMTFRPSNSPSISRCAVLAFFFSPAATAASV
jgi:hypothetical protein